MGRVSKFRKVRACDPFYKGPRKPSVRKGDFPPSNDDEQLPPKGLLHILNPTVAKRKSKNKSKVKEDESKVSGHSDGVLHSSGIDLSAANNECQKQSSPAFVRKPGESRRDYFERIDMETKIKLAGCMKREKKSERRKRYLKERKKKFLSKVSHRTDCADKEFSDFRDEVKFGEVVQAPPKLSAKPRGSQPRRKKGAAIGPSSSSSQDCPTVVGLKEERDMEEERLKMISHYRLTKKLKMNRKLIST